MGWFRLFEERINILRAFLSFKIRFFSSGVKHGSTTITKTLGRQPDTSFNCSQEYLRPEFKSIFYWLYPLPLLGLCCSMFGGSQPNLLFRCGVCGGQMARNTTLRADCTEVLRSRNKGGGLWRSKVLRTWKYYPWHHSNSSLITGLPHLAVRAVVKNLRGSTLACSFYQEPTSIQPRLSVTQYGYKSDVESPIFKCVKKRCYHTFEEVCPSWSYSERDRARWINKEPNILSALKIMYSTK